ncbi:MAG: sodium-translocating pyrophosphatase [Candidatus Aenigmarchaeota archaeon]|nr:sodium-translocating pyrophosphatase [Candidatus Aenigmarchaeota archaeon]
MLELAILAGLLAVFFSVVLAQDIMRQDAGTEKMKEISKAIQQGSNAYLKRQYKTLIPVVLILSAALYFIGVEAMLSFIFGVIMSALAGWMGMNISVKTNSRVAHAASKGLKEALSLAFKGGAVTGMMVVGLGLLGVSALFILFGKPELIIGFGFGASLISLFMRVGGGIYTKAADVGADLVGKVEKGIPEDDPRNPAVIADNVGDNVGDCAGMAADVFESYAVALIASMLLGVAITNGVIFPLVIGATAIFASIIGTFFVRLGKNNDIWAALNKGLISTTIISAILFYLTTVYFFNSINLFFAALTGLIATVLISMITEYYTSRERKPVREVAKSATTGAATNIISGLALGLQSTAPSILVIVAAILASYYFGGVYGIAIAALGMLSVTGMIVAIDAYGPITDNAGGIAEMSKLPVRVRKITDALDAVGNTTKAVTKGFAIGSAALAALSLFAAYSEAVNLQTINILSDKVVAGLFIGGAIPFLFSSFLMKAVGNAAMLVVEEVRRQFKTIKGLMEGKAKPDYGKAVDISTQAALRELTLPGMLAVLSPIVVGFILGTEALGGMLAGSIVTGLLLALTFSNAGAAWDNAKKYIETGAFGGKGSDAHKAAVVGDTVGDPSKDTAGPSLNPLIKVLNTISLIFATLFVSFAI